MNIKLIEKNACLEYITKMAYSTSETEYNTVHKQFVETAPKSCAKYFEDNWHPIREEWVMGFMFTTGNFLNRTNNRLESLNQKLKSGIDKRSSLEYFFRDFFSLLSVLRNEVDYRAIKPTIKHKINRFPLHSPEDAYASFLIPYACKYLLDQIRIADLATYQWGISNSGVHNIQTSDGMIKVTHQSCTCLFSKSMLLPCRHIFALRNKDELSLYDQIFVTLAALTSIFT